jgi:hydrogenase-4 component E
MNMWTDTLLVFLTLTSLLLLGSSRLIGCIRTVALQGVLLGALTVAAHAADLSLRPLLLAVAIIILKGVVFPWLLARVLRDAVAQRDVEPFVSYTVSLLIGTGSLGLSLWLSRRLPLPTAPLTSLLLPVALFTIFAGLLLIVSRRKALTQVIGYLVLENGIYIFGVGLVQGTPVLVELGVLLDVFVAVFVMGIALFHINREFDHVDADRLVVLRDWAP